jgi:hypothetical protein
MDDSREALLRKKRSRRIPVGEIKPDESEIAMALQDVEARFLQLGIIVIVDVVDANDLATGRQQKLRNVESYETGSSGDQYRIVRHRFSGLGPNQSTSGSFSQSSLASCMDHTILPGAVKKHLYVPPTF